jgi:hypothetical protein
MKKPDDSIDALLACQRQFAFLQQLASSDRIRLNGKRISLRVAITQEAAAGVDYVNMAIESLTT